jgi:ATP dependent DNA ligase C terminal region
VKLELGEKPDEFGLEGLVAKKPNSVYESGRRSGAWVKYKITKSQEFVIGGYTLPQGSRSHFGSLLVGYNSPDGLVFAGRVGTGFSHKVLANLYNRLQRLRQPACPFINLPEKTRGCWGLGITPAVMKRCQWLKPVLIAQVKFTEWTHHGQLRQPVFLGLRTDKEAKDEKRGPNIYAMQIYIRWPDKRFLCRSKRSFDLTDLREREKPPGFTCCRIFHGRYDRAASALTIKRRRPSYIQMCSLYLRENDMMAL